MYPYDAPQKRDRHPLASAAPLPFHQSRDYAEGPEHAGEDVRYGHPNLRQGTTDRPGEAHQAPFTLHDLAETRPVTVRPTLPEARDRERHQPRVQFLEFSLPRPSFSITSGRKFSMTTSDRRIMSFSFSRSPGTLKSSTTDFLLRFTERKYVDSPFTNGGSQPRLSSPFPGRSAFITSAPASASIMVA